MNFLSKLLIQLLLVTIIALLAFWLVSSVLIDQDHNRFYTDYLLGNMNLGYNLISRDIETLNTSVNEEAKEFEVILFLGSRNFSLSFDRPSPAIPPPLKGEPINNFDKQVLKPESIPSLSEDSLKLSNLAFVYIYNLSGNMAYKKETFDIKRLSGSDLNDLHSIVDNNLVYAGNSGESLKNYTSAGFIQVSDKIIIYASSLVKDKSGEIMGTLISGRMITEKDTDYYSSILASNISLIPVDNLQAFTKDSVGIGTISSDFLVYSVNRGSDKLTYTVYPAIKDKYVVLQGSWDLPAYMNDMKYVMIGGFCLVFLIFILIILALLDREILSRMRWLKRNMKQIESEKMLSVVDPNILIVPGNDDITDFSKGLSDLVSHILIVNKELNEAKKEAESANLAKSIFLANMSHEIRTPLNAIIGFSSLMEHENFNPRVSRYIKSIHTAGNSLLSLINDILDLSKIDANKLELSYGPVDLVHLCEELSLIFGERAKEKGLMLSLSLPEEVPVVNLDENRIRQVLLNVVGNAVKFTESGSISIALLMEKIREEQYILSFIVKDTGIGIPKEYMDKIFRAFEQQDPSLMRRYGGTGLGLSISRKIIKKMGGAIEVESEQGKGTVFTIKIPARECRNRLVLEDAPHIDNLPVFSPLNVLVVDDIENNRLVLADMLEKMGLEVIMVESPYEAIRMINICIPDLIFTDIRMPGMNGEELLMQIKKMTEGRDIPVIALTAHVNRNDETGIEGFNDIIIKPIRIEDIIPVLRKYIPLKREERISSEKSVRSSDKKTGRNNNPAPIDHEIAQEAKEFFSERMNTIIRKFIPNEVTILADDIENFGKIHNINNFNTIAKTLRNAAEEFDIKQIKEIIKMFQELVDND
jgi:signal transduction histidine kinase/CheY-like chemotaxis protein